MTIHRRAESVAVQAAPGITRRTLVHGPRMLTCEFTLEQGHELPMHSHPHEQTGYVVSGRIRLHIDGKSFELGAGDSYYAGANVPHGLRWGECAAWGDGAGDGGGGGYVYAGEGGLSGGREGVKTTYGPRVELD